MKIKAKIKSKLVQKEKREEKQVELQNKINDQIDREKILQNQGKLENPKCSFASSKGARCKMSVSKAGDRCTVHEKVEQNATGKKSQCKGTRTNGKRCGMMTSNKSGYCYYHD